MSKDFPQRKHPRLKEYDYSTAGGYFVTICTQDRACILSSIVGRGLAPAEMKLTECGEIAERELLGLTKRYSGLTVAEYVVMPNHIHILFCLEDLSAGASPRPTLPEMVCAYKSLVTRKCGRGQIFQTSFYEHVIRNERDYEEIQKYIIENPLRWEEDALYME